MQSTNFKSIYEVSRTYNVTARALRFYEERGMLPAVRIGSLRHYSAEGESALQFILDGKRLGFSLAEIATLIKAAHQSRGFATILSMVDRTGLDQKIASAEARRRELDDVIDELYKHKTAICSPQCETS